MIGYDWLGVRVSHYSSCASSDPQPFSRTSGELPSKDHGVKRLLGAKTVELKISVHSKAPGCEDRWTQKAVVYQGCSAQKTVDVKTADNTIGFKSR